MLPEIDGTCRWDACVCTLLTLCPQCNRHHRWVRNAVALCELEGDEEGDQTPVKPCNSEADLVPPLFVFKCIELEFTLEVASRENDSFN